MLRLLPNRVGGPGPTELADMVILLIAGKADLLDMGQEPTVVVNRVLDGTV